MQPRMPSEVYGYGTLRSGRPWQAPQRISSNNPNAPRPRTAGSQQDTPSAQPGSFEFSGTNQPFQSLGLPGGPPQFNADNSQAAASPGIPDSAGQSPNWPQPTPVPPNYYSQTYATAPSVNAPQVNAQDFGPTGGANTAVAPYDPRYAAMGANDPNQFPGQTHTGNPNDFAGNFQHAYGRPFSPAGEGYVALPGSPGQFITRSGGSFSQPGTPMASESQFRAALRAGGPAVEAYLAHLRANNLPIPRY